MFPVLTWILLACVGMHSRVLHADAQSLREASTANSPYLKAHLRDGGVAVFPDSWVIEGGDVVGDAWVLDPDRRPVGPAPWRSAPRPQRVALHDVALFETNDPKPDPVIVSMTVITTASIVGTVLCATTPKACFGSCPTFYVDDDGEPRLEAEGFSDSIAPALEATDVDALPHASAADGVLTVRMTNEALETHVVRDVSVLAAPLEGAADAWMRDDGSLLTVGPVAEPTACAGPEGDCTALVRKADDTYRSSLTDPRDLATEEVLELRFDEVPEGPLGLVVSARQSLVHTFVFYSGLDALGPSVGSVLARLDNDGGYGDRLGQVMGALGGITVEVARDGVFEPVGTFRETGPLATNHELFVVDPPTDGPLDVRLRMSQGAWRIDRVGLVPVLGEAAPVRRPLASVTVDGVEAPELLARFLDPDRAVTTLPGDEMTLTFEDVPDDAALFLESTGYYLEWMRGEWMERPRSRILLAAQRKPARVLELLAPEFKAVEATIEDQFWGSRYVRD